MKVAFDENVPPAMVRVFQLFAAERQVQFLTRGLTIESARDYTPATADPDYAKKSDVPWLKRFAKAGGKVVISGDVRMKTEPHERLALIEEGFIVFFFDRQWSGWKFFPKCSLLLHWWPKIAARMKRAKPGSFYAIPATWNDKAKLRLLSSDRSMKMEKQRVAKPKTQKKAEPRARKKPRPAAGQGDLLSWKPPGERP